LKKLILIAVLLATPAFAEEVPVPEARPAPAATPTPPQAPVTSWKIEGTLEQQDINSLTECIGEMKKKNADPFAAKLNSMLKPVR